MNDVIKWALTMLIVTMVIGVLPTDAEGEIYDDTLRLHILANSDKGEDQALKLKVRDRVIELVTPAVDGCASQSEAIAAIGSIMDKLELEAAKVVESEGYDYDVEVLIGEEYYPTKTYETCAFPEGEYVSLRVCIGEAEGQNWWCCLFPPLCLSAASDDSDESNEDAFISVGLTGEQYKIITETKQTKYRIRFKILEAIQKYFK